jgi:6-phosphofructokinase 1
MQLNRRIAINLGGGYVPGVSAAISGAVLAATELGWEVVGIRDGFDGLLHPDRYSDRGIVALTRDLIEHSSVSYGGLLGTAARSDPFHVRMINADNAVEEVDQSDTLLNKIRELRIDGVISIAGSRALSILFKLHRKGFKTVCIPKSVENDVAATQLSFGYNSALSFAIEVLDRARQAAQAAQKIAVVELLGERAGWLALQAGMAVCADAILIPEVPYNLGTIASQLQKRCRSGRSYGLVVVAEGAHPVADLGRPQDEVETDAMKASLSPNATGQSNSRVIHRSGYVAETVALQLQRLTDLETYPLVLGQLVKGGPSTAVDRQLGLSYGAAAVQALHQNQTGVMVTFHPPEIQYVPLTDAINKVRSVPADSVFMKVSRSLGICFGDEVTS